ncbi:PK1L2 protein, partial [Amia calva]|nr:PK1L2 protein [Amia calva]
MPRKCDKVSYKNISTASGNAVTTSFNNTISNNTVILIVEPNKNITLKLLLAYQYLPNETFSHYNTTLKWKLTEGSSVQVGYRWLLSPQMLSLGYGTWYVHITPLNLTKKENVNISIFSFSTKCTYWDKTNNRWGSEGCQVGLQSQPWQTQCLCNHLTFFGSSFFVMPNQVDLSQTAALFATVSKNPVVVALLSVFFGLYLITLVWAWNADKKAQKKRKLTLLDDNHHCAQYYYLFNVQTGHRSGAGTSAKVHVTVRGSDGESDPHHLNDPEKPVFGRGGVDMFLLSTPFSLGELQSIHLWHDNSGGNPAWYLDKVLIQDLQTRRCWHFLCSTWLCSTRGDRMTDRTFHPAKKNEITSFSNIFQSKTSSGFRDEHIWISILDPPQRSPFTRVQRVSCCMCLLLCTMAINIIFWNLPTDSQSPVIIKVGSFHVTWQEIMIGIESGLLMFPINILIITIFRSIKPRQAQSKEKEQDSGISETKMAPVPTLKSLLKDTEDLVTCLSKHATNKVPALDKKLELPSDLIPALELVNGVIMQMQDENNTDPHWIYCSQFVFCSLSHLSESLGSVGENAFPSSADYKQVQHTIAQMLKQVEVICSKQKPQSPPPVAKKKKSKSCWLPWWFVFVGWALLLSISGISTFFTLLYGFFYGKDSSLKWIMSLGLSLFQSIFVLQPLKVVGLAIFFALILKPVENVESDEVQSLLAVTNPTPFPPSPPGETVGFRKDRSSPHYQPPAPLLQQTAWDLWEEKRNMYILLWDILEKNTHEFNFHCAIRGTVTNKLQKVQRLQDFYPWANASLLPSLYGPYRGFISDGNSKLIGSPRIRQLRVRASQADYEPGWSINTTTAHTGAEQAWLYCAHDCMKESTVWGRLALYQGAGYAVELGTELWEAERMLTVLSQHGWLDAHSRALFVEFNIYNANIDLLGFITLSLETSGEGGVFSSFDLHCMSLYLSMGSSSMAVHCAQILFIIFIFYYMVKQCLVLREQKLAYFQGLLNLLELLIVLMGWTGLGLFIAKVLLRQESINQYHQDKTRYISFSQAATVDRGVNYLIACLVLLGTVKLWHLLRLNPHLHVLTSAVRRAWGELQVLLLFICILLMAYSLTCHLLYGHYLNSYTSFYRSFITMILLLMGSFNYSEVRALTLGEHSVREGEGTREFVG